LYVKFLDISRNDGVVIEFQLNLFLEVEVANLSLAWGGGIVAKFPLENGLNGIRKRSFDPIPATWLFA
jgi:hypothetical protein